jgi:hypothetical protein
LHPTLRLYLIPRRPRHDRHPAVAATATPPHPGGPPHWQAHSPRCDALVAAPIPRIRRVAIECQTTALVGWAPSDDRRPSHLFSLLNDLSVVSPRSPPSSAGSGSISPRMARVPPPASAPAPAPPHIDTYAHAHAHHAPMSSTPLSAPLPGTRPHYFGDERRSTNGPVPPRPDLFRRHSSHPYEYNPASQPVAYRHVDYTPVGLGTSRAPISRTTKACNACRARKVRCDAGGNAGGEPSRCSRCRESGVPCVYSGAQKKRGPCPG